MNKKLFLFLAILLALCTAIQAQERYKLNLGLHLELQKLGQSDQILPLFVKGDLATIERTARQVGGSYKFGVVDIARVEIPANRIADFASKPQIERIEYNNEPGKVLNDFVRPLNNLDSLHQGLGNLPAEVQGEGVLLGTIDTGLEWRHPDFINDDGSTRIRYMWDQRDTCINNIPDSYTYGCEWNSADIDADILTHDPEVSYAHGTRVMGLAAGNGRAAGAYHGGAPKADLIHVNINFASSFYANFVDAVYYIFEKADELDMPCVINSSVGSYRGPHDGSELATALIENILDAKSGRVLVQAAGNGGEVPMHISYPVTADTVFTWFRFNGAVPGIGFDLYADTADLHPVQFGFRTLHRNNYTYYGNTRFYNILDDMDLSTMNPVDSIVDSLVYNGVNRGNIKIYGELVNDYYYLFYKITPLVDNSNNWEFRTTGSGKFHIWSQREFTGTSKIVDEKIAPGPGSFPNIVNYKFPDDLYNIVSGWNCSEKIISVANYNNATYLTTYEGDTLFNANGANFYEQGERVFDSSIGPTRVGLQKPDIAATGNHTFSATTLARLDFQRVNEPNRVAPEGWHVLMGGTSAASPVVAGAVACYLELYPESTYSEVKADLENTATSDSFVVNGYPALPNCYWGYGKLDAFNFVSQQVAYGCTNVNAENYDPLATVDDGTCIIMGCTDSTATNYDPMATVDDGTCFLAGCTDSTATNYDPMATVDDGTCFLAGCTDSTATNYDPMATVDDGTCFLAGCTDSTATNYDPMATVDDGTCEFPSAIGDVDDETSFLLATPNPFMEKLLVTYAVLEIGEKEIQITDIAGRQLRSRSLENSAGSITLLRNDLHPGVYFLSLVVDDIIILTEKIIVL